MERARRNACRTQLTKAANNVKVILEGDHSLEDICAAISKLKLANTNLQEADNKMQPLLKENIEGEFLKMAEYEETATELITRLEFRKEKLERAAANDSASDKNSTSSLLMTNVPAVKLQRLELAKFDGDPKLWIPFWEQFRCSVHNNAHLSNGDKFNYLKMALTGKAAEAIGGFPPSGAFYDEALNILKEQFGNNDRLINQYLDSLMKLEQVRSKGDVETLRKNYNLVTSTIRSLAILQVPTAQYNVILKSSLLKSLPSELRLAFFRQEMKETEVAAGSSEGQNDATGSTISAIDEAERQVKGLLKFMRGELEALERTFPTCDNELQRKKGCSFSKQRAASKGSATSLMVAQGKGTQDCFLCKKDHKTELCDAAFDLNKKKQLLKDGFRCYRCTRPHHNSKQCANRFIVCRTCKGRHATTMCDPKWLQKMKEAAPLSAPVVKNTGSDPSPSAAVSSLMANSCKSVLLQTACVFAGSSETDMQLIRLVIDGGSQLTFVKETVSRKLGLPVVGQHNISIAAFGSKGPVPATICNRVLIKLKGQYRNEIITIDAVEVPEICMDNLSVPNESSVNVSHLQLADRVPHNVTPIEGISVLIGADHDWTIVTGENRRLNERLVAVQTKFGYALHGPIPINSMCVTTNLQTVLHASIMNDEPEVQRLWDLESIGIYADVHEGENFADSFSRTSIKMIDNRYEVTLPWKNQDLSVENNNFIDACVRAKRLRCKLEVSHKLDDYNNAIGELINSGYAEAVNNDHCCINDRVHYMPHRPVFGDDKDTTKLRIVFDASAHSPGSKSLNDLLEKGPNLNPDLISLLLNFRTGAIGVTADIEKAFLQVLVNNRDKDLLRFLWYRNNGEMLTYRMTRVTFGITCSPFLLSAVIQRHLRDNEDKNPQVIRILQKGFYVYDLVISVNDRDFAIHLKESATDIFQRASMNLRKWTTNDPVLNNNGHIDSKSLHKVLGINWHVVSDSLSVDLKGVTEYVKSVNIVTKRSVLQAIARVYDPLGLIGPFLIKIKILFQRIWKAKPEWDDLLSNEFRQEWNEWINQLPELSGFSVPRYLIVSEMCKCQLHIFADASLQAYDVAAYIRSENSNGLIKVMLLCSKSRVAPLKNCSDKIMTLPRLELTAALLAARLHKFLKLHLSVAISDTIMWTDSKITLHWINGDPNRWKVYVANRVKELQSLSAETRGWYHCPGRDNPADLVTRGIKARNLENSAVWLHGPSWLRETEENWPTYLTNENEATVLSTLVTNSSKQPDEVSAKCPFIDITKFSNFDRLLRVTAYTLRFINNVRFTDNRITGNVTVNEIEKAEMILIKTSQYQDYCTEIICLQNNKCVPKTSKIITLNPFMDDNGVLRVKGRLQNINADFNVKHPIILSKYSPLSTLLINKMHRSLHHSGVNAVLYEIRKRFWFIRARQLIKSIIAKCVICKKLRGKAASAPFAPLPRDRVMQAKPFEVTGLDFAGPLYCKENGIQKAYLFLFTCAVTRALHLELVPNMNTETSILALRRFMARRGVPKTIYSDNAKTFKRVSLELDAINQLLDSQELNDLANDYRIKWKFIVERAAWWGGFWERIVKCVKDSLRASVGRFLLDREQLTTLITEVEATINARPLTYMGDDPAELLPLTPSHFLLGTASNTLPFVAEKVSGSDLRKQWRLRLKPLDYFWKRWSVEYLQQLRTAHHNDRKRESSVNVGDIVLVQGNDSRRLLWKMELIVEVYPGRDGKVRACKIRYANGSTMRRPVQLLYPLEIN